MIQSSLWLSLLTAIFSAELSSLTSGTSNKTNNGSCQSSLVTVEESTEEQKINEEAMRSLGNKLLRL